MDTKNWIEALGLAQQYPVLIVAAVVLLGAGFWFAWWLRGHWATATIEALRERLELVREQLDFVKPQLADAEEKVAAQEREIAQLRASGARTQRLEQSTYEIRRALDSVTASTSAIDATLSIPNVVRALSKPSATKRSD